MAQSTLLALVLVVFSVGCATGAEPSLPGADRRPSVSAPDASAPACEMCGSTTPAPAPAPAPEETCGELDEPCCIGSACTAGLDCVAGTCATAGGAPPTSACGEESEPCCVSPTPPCAPGNVCIGGTCGADGAAPPGPDTGCVEFDLPCTVDADCCSGLCFDGYCGEDPGAAMPPPDDACGAATDCFDCTMLAACGFCDGRCVTSDTGAPPADCLSWSWLPYECGF